jgi:hypothetical protein
MSVSNPLSLRPSIFTPEHQGNHLIFHHEKAYQRYLAMSWPRNLFEWYSCPVNMIAAFEVGAVSTWPMVWLSLVSALSQNKDVPSREI